MLVWDDTVKDFRAAQPQVESVAEAKAIMYAEIERHAARLRQKYVGDVSPYEAASWALKLAEAAKYQATGLDSDAPMLDAEAGFRGVALPDLVTKVLNNAAQLGGLEALISGVSGKHRDAIALLQDAAEALNYDWRSGWPD